MNSRHENSLQTAARWGRNVLIGVGVAYALFKFITAWISVWYRLFPGVRRHMERKYGREQAYIEFVSRGGRTACGAADSCFLGSRYRGVLG